MNLRYPTNSTHRNSSANRPSATTTSNMPTSSFKDAIKPSMKLNGFEDLNRPSYSIKNPIISPTNRSIASTMRQPSASQLSNRAITATTPQSTQKLPSQQQQEQHSENQLQSQKYKMNPINLDQNRIVWNPPIATPSYQATSTSTLRDPIRSIHHNKSHQHHETSQQQSSSSRSSFHHTQQIDSNRHHQQQLQQQQQQPLRKANEYDQPSGFAYLNSTMTQKSSNESHLRSQNSLRQLNDTSTIAQQSRSSAVNATQKLNHQKSVGETAPKPKTIAQRNESTRMFEELDVSNNINANANKNLTTLTSVMPTEPNESRNIVNETKQISSKIAQLNSNRDAAAAAAATASRSFNASSKTSSTIPKDALTINLFQTSGHTFDAFKLSPRGNLNFRGIDHSAQQQQQQQQQTSFHLQDRREQTQKLSQMSSTQSNILKEIPISNLPQQPLKVSASARSAINIASVMTSDPIGSTFSQTSKQNNQKLQQQQQPIRLAYPAPQFEGNRKSAVSVHQQQPNTSQQPFNINSSNFGNNTRTQGELSYPNAPHLKDPHSSQLLTAQQQHQQDTGMGIDRNSRQSQLMEAKQSNNNMKQWKDAEINPATTTTAAAACKATTTVSGDPRLIAGRVIQVNQNDRSDSRIHRSGTTHQHSQSKSTIPTIYFEEAKTPDMIKQQQLAQGPTKQLQQHLQQQQQQQQPTFATINNNKGEVPQIHLDSHTKIQPKVGTVSHQQSQQQQQQQSQPYNNQQSSNSLNSFVGSSCSSGSKQDQQQISAVARFPQPPQPKRDSHKSKRSSVHSSTNRSDSVASMVNQSTIPTHPNNYSNITGVESLNYEKISQNNSNNPHHSSLFAQIKDFSDTFISKTSQFFQTNFQKNSQRIGCTCDSGLGPDETCSTAYNWLFSHHKKQDLADLKQTYNELKAIKLTGMETSYEQIEKDLKRTFPSTDMFQGDAQINKLRSVLCSVAKYDPIIGYVQGMNMIAASLLYHAEEYIAFWLIQLIFEKLEMRDIFLPKLPGLSKHIQLIDILTLRYIPDLYSHFCSESITFDMFCSPWIFSLFGVVLTPQKLTLLYSALLEEGWLMFYKLVLAFLCYHKEQLFCQEMGEMLMTLTQANYKFDLQEQWEQLIRISKNIGLDARSINDMLDSYDADKKQFNLRRQ